MQTPVFRRSTFLGRLRAFVMAGLLSGAALQAGFAQDTLEFQLLSTPDGVWVNEIEDLLEDRDGAIWAATWGEGLHKIHGTKWETFNEAGGFVGDWQRCLALDGNGAVWVGTADGICRFRDGMQTVMTTENTPGLLDHSIEKIISTESGDLLVGTEQGYLFRCPAADLAAERPSDWQTVLAPDLAGGRPINDIIEVDGGHLWVSLKQGGLLEFDGRRWSRAEGISTQYSYIFGRRGHRGAEIWLAHESGGASMYRFGPSGWTEVEYPGDGVGCFLEGHDGTSYIGTTGGARWWDGAEWRAVDLGREIGAPNVRAMLFASDGSLWLGSQEGLIRGAARSWSEASGIPLEKPLLGLVHGPPAGDSLYLLDRSLALSEFVDGHWESRTALVRAGEGTPKSWTASRDGRLWVLFENGESVEFALDSGAAIRRLPLPGKLKAAGDPYVALYLAPSGTLYLHSDVGIHRLADGEWRRLENTNETYVWQGVFSMTEAPDGTLFFAGRAGMSRWKDGVAANLGAQYGVALDDSCHAVCVRRNGEIWFGTHGSGIYVLVDGAFDRITRKDGLRSDAVSGLYESTDGTMWAAYRRQGLGRYREGHWLNYGILHGLANTAIGQVVEYPPGAIWTSTDNGQVFRYQPDGDAPETRIAAAPDQVDAHGIASFSFTGWDAWDHTPRGQLQYSTRIIALDVREQHAPWSPLQSATTLVTPELPVGRYRFEARASDEDGNVDPEPASAAFRILPPLWMKPQFVLPLALAAAFSLLMLMSRYRDYLRLQRSQVALELANRSLVEEIAERDRVEQALRKSESHLEEAQYLTKLGSWDLDPVTNTGTWSREMYQLFQRDPGEGAPQLEEFLQLVHPEDRVALMEQHGRLFQTGEPFEMEFRSNPEHGPVRYFIARVRGLVNEHGKVQNVSGATQEITAQKLAELEHGELEEKLRQSQKLEAVGQLAGGIAHDFNNILHALLGFCQLARESGLEDRELVDECLEGIELSGRRAADLVRQLLTFSRREKPVHAVLHLEPILDEALTLLRRTLPSTIEIRREIAPLCYPVFADTTQVHQVILNLCTNAAQAMETAGGTLRLELRNVTFPQPSIVTTGELPAGEYVRLSVVDTGPGIDPAVLEYIFDPFFTTKETGQGTGLGLATVHGIVASLGGAIAVHASPGHGTEFHVFLKRCTEVADAGLERSSDTATGQAGAGRVLFVDDEEDIVRLTRRALMGCGFDVDAYSNPGAALAAFLAAPDAYSIVVTDLTMPKMTGVVLAARVRAVNPAVPVILLSGRLEDGGKPSANIAEVLRKPLPMDALVKAILRHIAPRPHGEHATGGGAGTGPG